MCGRYALTKPDRALLKKRFDITLFPQEVLRPRFNISPSQNVPVILNESPKAIKMARWGLIPFWAKDEKIGYKMINARSETIAEKPSFRNSIKKRRCLILCDSFYEWNREGETKIPFRIMMKDENYFAMCGIWDIWKKDDKEIISCSIITTGPNKVMKKIHDRMPVILPREKETLWLSDLDIEKVLKLLNPCDDKLIKAYEISTLVNSPSNNTEAVIAPIPKSL